MNPLPNPDLRCGPLPLVARRALNEAERHAIGRLARRLWLQPLVAGLLGVGFLAMLGWLAGLETRLPEDALTTAMVASMSVLAVGVCLTWDSRRRALAARGDLAADTVWVFATETPVSARVEVLPSGVVVGVAGAGDAALVDAGLARRLALAYGPRSRPSPRWWPDDAAATGRWCNGLPLVARRDLTDAERAELAGLRRRQRTRLALAWGLPAAWLAVSFVGVMRDDTTVWAILGLFSGIAMLLLSVPLATAAHRWQRALRTALEGGWLAACDLRVHHGPHDVQRLTLELLDGGLVWAANGCREADFVVLPIVDVAPAPEMSAMAANFMLPVELEPGRTAQTNERDLSALELAELGQVLARSRPQRLVLPLLVLAAVGGRMLWLAAHGSVTAIAVAALILWLAAGNARLLRRQLSLRAGLLADHKLARVRQLDPSQWPDQSARTGVPAEAQYVEVLPHSGLLWSVAGAPAGWRLG